MVELAGFFFAGFDGANIFLVVGDFGVILLEDLNVIFDFFCILAVYFFSNALLASVNDRNATVPKGNSSTRRTPSTLS